MNLHGELQNLVNKYKSDIDELIKKNYMEGKINTGTTYRDGIIDDLKYTISDLNSLLSKYKTA